VIQRQILQLQLLLDLYRFLIIIREFGLLCFLTLPILRQCVPPNLVALLKKRLFANHNTKLLGLSLDSIHSHIAWVNAVQEKTGVLFEFPIIADVDMKIANLYGMLQSGESETAVVRAVFLIHPAGKIRLIMYYPLNVGRNMAEIKRVLLALQTVSEHSVACPLDWMPGDKVIVPAPKTIEALA
jgi:peroxiredoxin (alkyl hydroperoxide reductase subunit C)